MPQTGDLIGPYRLVSLLGKGAMGEVWRAHDERLGRYVALKVLPRELAEDPERRARMLREARAAAAIRHANVVTLFDIVQHEGEDILVMELVEGRTLSDVLRKDGAPTLETALRWIEGITDALTAAHARNILHRDIKAANVMVTPEGGIKVLDFGLAKLRGDEPAASASLRMQPADREVALDETRSSEPGTPAIAHSSATEAPPAALDATQASGSVDSYQTQAGSLLGTPLYMAPEQIAGELPDERSEVFSVGVLAYEVLVGKSPYSASSLDVLFKQITSDPPPPFDGVPAPIDAIVRRALDKEPAARWQSMQGLHDAVAAERKRQFAQPARRWPLAVAAILLVIGCAAGVYAYRATRTLPERPGDKYVERALEEYDVFYNDKALSSLRAALRVTPEHPRANAYMLLFGGASADDRDAALAAAKRALPRTTARSKDRALLDAAIAYAERGAAVAKAALLAAGATHDRELLYWAAALDWRSGQYEAARDGFRTLLEDPAHRFRGRIYDQYSSVLIYFDEPEEALRVGTLYRDAFPGEPDAVAVYATTLAIAGRYDDAVSAAEEALRLNEGEDTLAGLAKVFALHGDHPRAKELYKRSIERAGPARRPIRRAALGLLQWIDGELESARQTVAPCLDGEDAKTRERGQCLFVAGVIDPDRAEEIAIRLDTLATEATPTQPAYGSPASLAALVRARAKFFGGACVVEQDRVGSIDPVVYRAPLDFFATYHLPYFSTWSVCELAAWSAVQGRATEGAKILRRVFERSHGRDWLRPSLERYDRAY